MPDGFQTYRSNQPHTAVTEPAPPTSEVATLVQAWRCAYEEHGAACAAGDGSAELRAQMDAACNRQSETFGALCSIVGTNPALLRGHADALEYLLDEMGELNSGVHDATLGRSIITELRMLADERERHSVPGKEETAALAEFARCEAELRAFTASADDNTDIPDEMYDRYSVAKEAFLRGAFRSAQGVVQKIEFIRNWMKHGPNDFDGYVKDAVDGLIASLNLAHGLSETIDDALRPVSPVMTAAVKAAEALTEFNRRDTIWARACPEGDDQAKARENERLWVWAQASDHHRAAWDEVMCAYPAADLADAAIHAVRAIDPLATLESVAKSARNGKPDEDACHAVNELRRLLYSIMGVLPVQAVPPALVSYYGSVKTSPWTGRSLVEGPASSNIRPALNSAPHNAQSMQFSRASEPAPWAEPDAELLTLCDIHDRNQATYNRSPDEDQEALPAADEAFDRLKAITPTTPRGHATKFRTVLSHYDGCEINGEIIEAVLADARAVAGQGGAC